MGSLNGPYINLKYTTQGDGNFTGTYLYFYKPMTITAYYPFNGVEGKVPGTDGDGVIVANTRAGNQDPDIQPGIDFLWDSQTGFTADDPNVNFKFSHKMSKITFTFQNSEAVYDQETGTKLADGVDVATMTSYQLNGLVLDGTFDTATGVCAVKTDASPETLSMDVKGKVVNDNAVDPLIVFPQTLNGGSVKLDIYTNELNDEAHLQHYICSLSFSDGKIEPGYNYKYTIKVTKIGLIVGKMTVEPWV